MHTFAKTLILVTLFTAAVNPVFAQKGTDPQTQHVTGTDPRPQHVTGTDPRPQSIWDAVLEAVGF